MQKSKTKPTKKRKKVRKAKEISTTSKILLTIVLLLMTPPVTVSVSIALAFFWQLHKFQNSHHESPISAAADAVSSPESWIKIAVIFSIIAIAIGLKQIWDITLKKLLKPFMKYIMRSIAGNIADEIEEAASSAISMSEVVEGVQTSEQSIEIEVETPEIVIQRQSKPANRTKTKLQKLKELHDEGLISDEDYAEEKRNILKEM